MNSNKTKQNKREANLAHSIDHLSLVFVTANIMAHYSLSMFSKVEKERTDLSVE